MIYDYRKRFDNFVEPIGFAADGARAWRETATARPAAIEPNGLDRVS